MRLNYSLDEVDGCTRGPVQAQPDISCDPVDPETRRTEADRLGPTTRMPLLWDL